MSISLRNRGFTLIELIAVIVILGALAAFAIPRFADVRSDARGAAIQGMVGTVRSAATLAHSKSLTQQLDPNDPIQMEGESIAMVGGYPDALGMAEAAQLIIGDDFQIQFFSNTAFIVYATGTPGWTSCGFAYVRAFPPAVPYPRYFGPYMSNCR